jgi:hypothetical protein
MSSYQVAKAKQSLNKIHCLECLFFCPYCYLGGANLKTKLLSQKFLCYCFQQICTGRRAKWNTVSCSRQEEGAKFCRGKLILFSLLHKEAYKIQNFFIYCIHIIHALAQVIMILNTMSHIGNCIRRDGGCCWCRLCKYVTWSVGCLGVGEAARGEQLIANQGQEWTVEWRL